MNRCFWWCYRALIMILGQILPRLRLMVLRLSFVLRWYLIFRLIIYIIKFLNGSNFSLGFTVLHQRLFFSYFCITSYWYNLVLLSCFFLLISSSSFFIFFFFRSSYLNRRSSLESHNIGKECQKCFFDIFILFFFNYSVFCNLIYKFLFHLSSHVICQDLYGSKFRSFSNSICLTLNSIDSWDLETFWSL